MNIQELKKFLKNSGMGVLVLDDGEPAFVAVNYETYKKLVDAGNELRENELQNSEAMPFNSVGKVINGKDYKPSPNETELIEKINNDILALKEEIENEEKISAITSIDEIK